MNIITGRGSDFIYLSIEVTAGRVPCFGCLQLFLVVRAQHRRPYAGDTCGLRVVCFVCCCGKNCIYR